AQVVEPRPRADVLVGQVDLNLVHRLMHRVRILARLELLPALEEADPPPRAREPGGGDRTPVARSDRDDLVVVLDLLERRGETRHRRSSFVRGTHAVSAALAWRVWQPFSCFD